MKRIRQWIARIARDEARQTVDDARVFGGVYHILSIQFAHGDKHVDMPFDPWRPRQTLDLPGRWDPDA